MSERFRVTIEDREAARLPVRVDCESVVAFLETNGQAAFSTRGMTKDKLALHAASILVRLYEMEPAILATAIVLIRKGKVATTGAGRNAATGEAHEVTIRPPMEVAAEVESTIRFALDVTLGEQGQ